MEAIADPSSKYLLQCFPVNVTILTIEVVDDAQGCCQQKKKDVVYSDNLVMDNTGDKGTFDNSNNT